MRQKSRRPKTALYAALALSILLLVAGCENSGSNEEVAPASGDESNTKTSAEQETGAEEPRDGTDTTDSGEETKSHDDTRELEDGNLTWNERDQVAPENRGYYDDFVMSVKPEIDYIDYRFSLVWRDHWNPVTPPDGSINIEKTVEDLGTIITEYATLRIDLRHVKFNNQDPYVHILEAYRTKMDEAILYRIDAAYRARGELQFKDNLTHEMYISAMSNYEYHGRNDPNWEAAWQEVRNYEKALKGK